MGVKSGLKRPKFVNFKAKKCPKGQNAQICARNDHCGWWGFVPGSSLVQRKPQLYLVIDENLTLFSTDLGANVLNFNKIKNNGKKTVT